jgi:hypothetical protein
MREATYALLGPSASSVRRAQPLQQRWRVRRRTASSEYDRQVGVKRILYGSDAAVGTNLRPKESWAAFRRLPLTEPEFKQIARNVAPFYVELANSWRAPAERSGALDSVVGQDSQQRRVRI